MKKIAIAILTFIMCLGCFGCSGQKYDDYYTFSVGSILTEMLVNSSQKLEPVVRNLGDVVEDPNYSVEITTSTGDDVTDLMYDEFDKIFTPSRIDEYSVLFTVTDERGNVLRDSLGGDFSKSVSISVVKLDIEPVTTMDAEGVTINHDDVSISFDSSMEHPKDMDAKQYKLTGVSFSRNFNLSYDVSNLGYANTSESPKIFVGFKRDTTDQEDDSFGFDPKNRTFNSWMKGVSAGTGWRNSGSGWMETQNRVSRSDGTHRVSISRIIDESKKQAYWTIEFDGKAMNYVNAGENYTENVVTVYFTTFLVSGTIKNISFARLEEDNTAPEIQTKTGIFGKEIDLSACVSVQDDQINGGFCKIAYEIKNENGTVIPVAGHRATVATEGNYTLKVTASDLIGNTSTASSTFRCGAMASMEELPMQYIINRATSINLEVTSDFVAIAKGQVRVRLLKDGNELTSAVNGTYIRGDITVTVPEEGTYTMQILYRDSVIGQMEVKGVTTATMNPEINLSEMTKNARTNLGHGVYFKVYDAIDGDASDDAKVMFERAAVGGFVDATDEVYDERNRVFRPNTSGIYYMIVSYTNSAGLSAEEMIEILVRDNEQVIYGVSELDTGIDMSGGITTNSLNTSVIKKDGLHFENMEGSHISPKFNFIPEGVRKNWSISFTGIDLKSSRSDANTPFAKLSMILILGNTERDTGLIFDTIGLEGKPADDVWGWYSIVTGARSITYAWASWGQSWYSTPTSEFDPNGQKIGNNFSYLGEHTYRLRCRTSDDGVVTYYMYIDEELFAVHDTSKFLGNNVTTHLYYSDLLGVQFCSQYMEGTIKDIKIEQE